MDLKTLITDEKLSFEGDFKGNKFVIEYANRSEMQAMNRRATVKAWKNHQQMEDIDEDKMALELAGKILSWDVKNKDLIKFFPIAKKASFDPEEAVECSVENKCIFLKSAYGFDSWMISTMTEIQNFQDENAEAEKKIM